MHYGELVRITGGRLHRAVLLRNGFRMLLILLVLLGTVPLFALGSPSRQTLTVSFASLFLVFLVSFIWLVLIPLFSRPSKKQILSYLEKRSPEFQGRLLLADYFDSQPEENRKLGYSEQLSEQTRKYAENIPEEILADLSISASIPKAWKVSLSFLLAADFVLVAFASSAFLRGVDRIESIFQPGLEVRKSAIIKIDAPERAARGKPVTIKATVISSENDPGPVLHWIDSDRKWHAKPMEKMKGKGSHYSHQISRLVRSTTFTVSVKDRVSSLRHIEAMDPPQVESFRFDFAYPEYTGMDNRTERKLDGNIQAPQGTRVTLAISANNPLERGYLEWAAGGKTALRIDRGSKTASASFLIDSASRYHILLRDTFGLELTQGTHYQIVAQEDEVPNVSFISPAIPVMDIPEEMAVVVSGQAEDDYGLVKAELVYQVGYDQPERNIELELTPLESGAVGAATPKVAEVNFQWDLRGLDLLPGESASYWLKAYDNDPMNGPKAGSSGVQVLRFPSMFEIYEEVQDQEMAQMDSMEDLLEQQKQLREEAQDLQETVEREAIENKEEQVPWEHKETLKELKEKQEEIQEQIEQLQDEFAKGMEQLEEDTAISDQTFEKMAKIQELMNQMLSQEMKQTLQKFNQAMEQLSPNLMNKSLENLDFSMEKFEESLDRTLSLLQQSYIEKNLERLSYQADQMAKTQQELLERTEQRESGQPMDDLARRQEKLNETADEFIKDASELAKMAEEAGNQDLKEKLDSMIQKAQEKQLEKTMEQSRENLAKGEKAEAEENQQQSKETMEQMCSALNECKQGMPGMSITFDIQQWHRLMDRVFYLSEKQEEFDKSLPPALETGLYANVPVPLNQFAVLESIYADEADRVAGEVKQLGATNPFIDMQVANLLTSSAQTLREWSVESKDRYGSSLRKTSRQGLGLLNMAIVKMLEVLETMMNMSASSSMESYFQALEQMIQQQQQINEMTKRLDAQGRERPEWMQQMQQMAQQQQMVRQAMEEMKKKYQHMSDLLGDMGKLGKEMQEIEELLQNQETGPKVQEKQERLLQRLLDAEKSVREQKDEKKRKSETAAEYEREGMPGDLDDAKTRLRKKALENKARLNRERIVPEYRDLLKSYFEKLSEQEL